MKQRRTDEMEMLSYLTGKKYEDWDVVSSDETKYGIPVEASYAALAENPADEPSRDPTILIATLAVMGLVSLAGFRKQV